MRMSQTINLIAPAFVKAQRQVEGARKDKVNGGFKSKYADLTSVWEACRVALVSNDLAVMQLPVTDANGLGVETVLLHSSGEWIAESFTLPFPVSKDGSVKIDAHAGCSCITYARRYALASLMGICPEDDDGNAATAAAQDMRSECTLALKDASEMGMDAYAVAWDRIGPEGRKAVGPSAHASFKASAARVDARRAKEANGATAAV